MWTGAFRSRLSVTNNLRTDFWNGVEWDGMTTSKSEHGNKKKKKGCVRIPLLAVPTYCLVPPVFASSRSSVPL